MLIYLFFSSQFDFFKLEPGTDGMRNGDLDLNISQFKQQQYQYQQFFMQSYPPELSYNNINPKGFFSTFKQWTIQPLASGGCYWPGQNIKILIQSVISGVMDPYRSHLQFQVEVDSQYLPVGALQVDNSAQSFIQQLVVNSKNRQIQRIPQYSVLAAWLTDCGLAQLYAQGRQTQGLGYTNVQSISTFQKQSQSFNNIQVSSWGRDINDQHFQNGFPTIFPTQNAGILPMTTRQTTITTGTQSGWTPKYIAGKNLKGHFGTTNAAWFPSNTEELYWKTPYAAQSTIGRSSYARTGYFKNLRAQYLQHMQSTMYPDSTTSSPTYQIHLNKQTLKQFTGTNIKDLTYKTGRQYTTYVPQNKQLNVQFSSTVANDVSIVDMPNITPLTGFSTLISPNFCKGVREPIISPTVPQCQMMNGKILRQKIPISKRTFKVPIISAILGLLIPQDQFVLLPIKALNQILMQFVVDKYAMFTSGYNDISQFDTAGMSIPQQRAFIIKRVFYKMHTYQFYSPQVDEYLNKSLMNRILLNCNMWTLGNQYQIVKGQNINNSWPVACTSQALNQIVVLFIPLDYQHYSFCRKHFRISNNVTKFQLRVNMDYFPSQPILGNGGNPMIIEGLDNSAYVQQIFWSNNFMFNKVNPWPRINAYNFAINQRCYDITKQTPLYDPAMVDNKLYQWTKNSVNYDTAMGMANVHQNRYVGKAGYVFGFQPYAHSAYHLTGLDCRQVRQFDVLLNTYPKDNFPRQQTMYIFTRSSVIVQYTENGINVYGR